MKIAAGLAVLVFIIVLYQAAQTPADFLDQPNAAVNSIDMDR